MNSLCIDIGGTKTAVALYDGSSAELCYRQFPTAPAEGSRALAERVYESVRGALAEHPAACGVIASPGPLDSARGVLLSPVMLGWKNEPVVKIFEEKFGMPFSLLNDCDAAALGVAEEFGFSEKGTLCYITISTGVGGGTLVDGKLLQGAGNASEFGHIPVAGQGLRCGCGKTDCLELYASGTGIENRYKAVRGEFLPCAQIAARAREGEQAAVQVFAEAAKYLADGVRTIKAVLDPDIIVFGGGVVKDGDLLLPGLRGCGVRTECTAQGGKQVLHGALLRALQMNGNV